MKVTIQGFRTVFQGPMTMTAPATAPQMFPVLAIPAPKPHEILYAVSLPGPRSPEKLDTTAGEQENPFLNRAAASSGFFMPEVLVRLRSIVRETVGVASRLV